MIQVNIEGLERDKCRTCGQSIKTMVQRRGRYKIYCDECGRNRRKDQSAIAIQMKQADLRRRRTQLVEKMGGRCAICLRSKKRLELHHKLRNYTNSSNKPRKREKKSYEHIINEAEIRPENFSLLCNSCHKFVTWLESDLSLINRLYGAIGDLQK